MTPEQEEELKARILKLEETIAALQKSLETRADRAETKKDVDETRAALAAARKDLDDMRDRLEKQRGPGRKDPDLDFPSILDD